MAYDPQIKCPGCGISVPDVPEGADKEEMLCNCCYALECEGEKDS
ncbi:hypothetical protein [Geoalkalibacter subterraneus]|nr:hypothetical protein [Geoalkalibacter subterraneus]